jgi:LppP/LprE lipoprotein/zinc-ribbon domain
MLAPEMGDDVAAFCTKCGKELGESDLFCRSCGTAVPQDEPGASGEAGSQPDATQPGDAAAAPTAVVPEVTEPGSGAPPTDDPGWWSDPRHRLISGLVAIAVVVGIVLAVVLLSSGGSNSSSPVVARSATTTTVAPSSSSTPSTSLPSAPSAASRPTLAEIAQVLAQTHDPNGGGTYQSQDSGTSPDGSGGLLTAVTGFDNSINHPPCLVFFWHNSTFIGTDARQPHLGCVLLSAGGEQFVVKYDNFAPSDPLCCPSQPPVDITYTWDGQSLTPNGALPGSP